MSIKKILSHIMFCLCAALTLPSAVTAGTIKLSIESSFSTETDNHDNYSIIGNIKVFNSGTESALKIFPGIKIEDCEWAGEQSLLQQNTSYLWTIKIDCSKRLLLERLTKDLHLNDKANLRINSIPALIQIYYQDSNGNQYSSPLVHSLDFSTFNEDLNIRKPNIINTLNCNEWRGNYSCNGQVKSDGSVSTLVASIYTSELVEAIPSSFKINIKDSQITKYSFQINNLFANPGSEYPVYLILNWENNSIIKSHTTTTNIKIVTRKNWLSWMIITSILAIISASIYLIRFSLMRNKKI